MGQGGKTNSRLSQESRGACKKDISEGNDLAIQEAPGVTTTEVGKMGGETGFVWEEILILNMLSFRFQEDSFWSYMVSSRQVMNENLWNRMDWS